MEQNLHSTIRLRALQRDNFTVIISVIIINSAVLALLGADRQKNMTKLRGRFCIFSS